jgi:phosphohistidine swiveling domain-containing protein
LSYTVSLAQASAADEVGGKAFALARLVRGGLRVPAAFCVRASALDYAIEAAGLGDAERCLMERGQTDGDTAVKARDALRAIDIPGPLREEILQGYRALSAQAVNAGSGWAAVAVRSSGLAEDSTRASFAGILESYLNITGPDDLLAAVRQCWASRLTDAAVSYRQQAVGNDSFRMGVLVQLLIPATASGVIFTADPVTGDRTRLVVNASQGLSSELLSGEVACDTFVLDRSHGGPIAKTVADKATMVIAAPGGGTERIELAPQSRRAAALSDTELGELHRCALRTEAVLGANLDMEWAFGDGELFVLQARPMTPAGGMAAAPEFTRDAPQDGRYWLCADELFPEPVCAWGVVLFEKFAEGLNLARASWKSPCLLRVATVAGWMYMADDVRTDDLPPEHRHEYEAAVARAVAEVPVRWRTEWRTAILARNSPRLVQDLGELTDAALLAGLQEWLTSLTEDDRVGGLIGMMPVLAMARLARADGEVARGLARTALQGLPSMLGEIEQALWELARKLAAEPRARAAFLAEPESAALGAVRAEPAAWEPVADFLSRYGYHGMESIESRPWHEDPAPLIALLRAKIDSDDESPAARMKANAERRARAIEDLVAAHPAQQQLIRDYAAELEACVPLDQDRYVVLTELGHAVTRRLVLEIGARLAVRGLLAEAVDALQLWPQELDQALRAGEDNRALVIRRRARLSRHARLRPPRTLGPVRDLAEVPYVTDSILSARSSDLIRQDAAAPATDAQVLGSGIPSSAGRYAGPATVCVSLAAAAGLRRGDVLVCETTSPAWTQYFGRIGAIVTERGGLLSHPAVVAREYGIPAVTGVDGASRTISSGWRIEVDGDQGLVVLEAAQDEPAR